jgi:Domain of unknown function (DUF4326)
MGQGITNVTEESSGSDTNTATRVIKIKDQPDTYYVYIGRENKRHGLGESKWANPYQIGKDGTRQEVIEKYRAYIKSRPDLLASLSELEGQTLGCWCAPEPCHGDVLIELLDESEDFHSRGANIRKNLLK